MRKRLEFDIVDETMMQNGALTPISKPQPEMNRRDSSARMVAISSSWLINRDNIFGGE
jgi:hypothetical protein